MNKIIKTIISLAVLVSVITPFQVFAQTASVDDFFEQVDLYKSRVAEREGRYTNTNTSTTVNPSLPIQYIPEQRQDIVVNNSDLIVNRDTNQVAMEGSASESSGEYGEVVRYSNNQAQNFQASAVNARTSSGVFNNGALLVMFMIILIVMILIRSRKKRKHLNVHRYQDGFHDMKRYQARYRSQPVR